MKKEIVILLAAAGMFAGCQQEGNEYNEPAGADREMRSTNNVTTNQINEPSGAATDSSSQQSGSQQPQSGAQSNP